MMKMVLFFLLFSLLGQSETLNPKASDLINRLEKAEKALATKQAYYKKNNIEMPVHDELKTLQNVQSEIYYYTCNDSLKASDEAIAKGLISLFAKAKELKSEDTLLSDAYGCFFGHHSKNSALFDRMATQLKVDLEPLLNEGRP